MPGRAASLPLLLIAGLSLAACGRDGPDDPAIATAGTGIPMGAVGALGAGFDLPAAHAEGAPAPRPTKKGAKPLPAPLPPDPFAEPPEEPGDTADPPGTPGDAPWVPGPPPHSTHRPPSKGTTL